MSSHRKSSRSSKSGDSATTKEKPTIHNSDNSAFGQLNSQNDHCYMHMPSSKLSVFLEERTKLVHFIRHAEGYHNEANNKAGNNTPTIYSTKGSKKYWDARLTPHGAQQCISVREKLEAELSSSNGRSKRIELVVVSPLTRTLQTAELIFGKADCQGAPPFLVHPLVRERTGYYTCDGRLKISEIQAEFPPCIDFSLCKDDEDKEWSEVRESDESVTSRGIEFLKWLSQRQEKEIAVVTHSSWLRHVFAQFGNNVVAEDKEALQRLAGNTKSTLIDILVHKRDKLISGHSIFQATTCLV